MNREELAIKLTETGVKPERYSLYGDRRPDCTILFHNYAIWEVYYLDERGGQNDEKHFPSENEACDYILELFIDSRKVEIAYLIK